MAFFKNVKIPWKPSETPGKLSHKEIAYVQDTLVSYRPWEMTQENVRVFAYGIYKFQCK